MVDNEGIKGGAMSAKSQPQDEDLALVTAAAQGDDWAATRLVDKYYNRLYHGLLKILRNPEDAKDATQEAFLQVFRAVHKFQNRSQFYTWLYKIAINCAFTIRRNWKKHHPQAENPLVFQDRDQEDGCPSVNPEENAEVQDEILRVRKGLELLGSDYRQVLILKEMEEMDYQTISELLDIPIGTVRSRLHRARQELRWILEQWDTRSTPKSEENSFGN